MGLPTGTLERIILRAQEVLDLRTPEGRRIARRLTQALERADLALARALKRQATAIQRSRRMSPADALIYQQQARATTRRVQAELLAATKRSMETALRTAERHARRAFTEIESAFGGTRGAGLPIPQFLAAQQRAGLPVSLLRQSETSVNNYGIRMVAEFERRIRLGLAAGLTQDEMVDQLTAHGGPRGMFTERRWMAERIVRTETARAYQAGNLETMREMQRRTPDLQKKIIATFDKRTAYDSVAVHGQVRPLDGYFVDGAGRVYLHPPARPNDREVIIPWRGAWKETPDTRALSQEEIRVRAVRIKEHKGISLPTTKIPRQ